MSTRPGLPKLSALLPLVVLLLLGGPARAVTFSDGGFDPADWSTSVFTGGVGGTGSAAQQATGGNPGAFWEIAISLADATGSGLGSIVTVVSIFGDAVYDPAASGAVASIDFHEDAILLSGFGSGHATTLALLQDGVLYAAVVKRNFVPELAWTGKQLLDLVESDFQGVVDPSLAPDFSTAGAPIQFGIWRAQSAPVNSTAAARTTGLDNWQVTVVPVPEPGSVLLLGGGLLGLAARRRTRRP